MAKLLSNIILLQAEIQEEERLVDQLELEVDLSLLRILDLVSLIIDLQEQIDQRKEDE
jgi:hypothetical protein